jgi:outer membrane protein
MTRMPGFVAAMLVAASVAANAQTAERLSLQDAEMRALQYNPAIKVGEYDALAANQVIREARSALFPTVFGALTGAESQEGSRIAAGALNNPIILDRLAYGVAGTQLITDFGRTSDLTSSARLRADSQQQDVTDRRARVLLAVDRAFFRVMRAQAVANVARETEAARQVVVDQVRALAATGLKSSLDLSFAQVSLSEAQLLRVQADNEVQAAYAELSNAMGTQTSTTYDLVAPSQPESPPADLDALIARALADRPDVARERFLQQSEAKFADAERALSFPTVSAAGAAGLVPFFETGLRDRYSAIGVNVAVPVFNGNLFAARKAEARFRATAGVEALTDLQNRVARDVRVTWLDVQTAFQRLALTDQLVAQAVDALDLAQQRYNLGLSSIVELTQAQLNDTRARIEQATARYDYQERNAVLRFQTGQLRGTP